ncbi:MAG: ribonuclease HII [Clostridium sp.]|uniref:ribonuclease HII n=1 Tax=Clostridium sp. TaxID=1506 RepID=UPI002A8CAF79|nr:ribonuclease HII [Clostridium sp.]MDY5098159.1 ribonuclease HII [Clostridium sp.]
MGYEGLKYKEIKEIIDRLDLNRENQEKILSIIADLKEDKRKNINSLGNRLQRNWDGLIQERLRVKALYDNDKSYGEGIIVAGVDEVGRGPLAGPIVAASVILKLNVSEAEMILGINDSKVLSEEKREKLSEIIKNKAIAYCICQCESSEIDENGIGYCNNKVFKDAVHGLSVKPDLVLSDGYPIKDFHMPNKAIIKGDRHSASIAAASIIAKVYRDNLMKNYDKIYPNYDFEHNAGYGTKKHIEGIKKYGMCKIHRRSFLNNIL